MRSGDYVRDIICLFGIECGFIRWKYLYAAYSDEARTSSREIKYPVINNNLQ